MFFFVLFTNDKIPLIEVKSHLSKILRLIPRIFLVQIIAETHKYLQRNQIRCFNTLFSDK